MSFVYLHHAGDASVGKLSERTYSAILLNQSCDVDKGYPKLVLLPVIPLSSLSADKQNLVKKNRIFSYLHLPPFRDLLAESFVSFLEPMVVSRPLLDNTKRIASLNETGRRALYVQYTRWLTRWQLAEVGCPGCGLVFNPSDTLPIENA